jgi:hypothetical protein
VVISYFEVFRFIKSADDLEGIHVLMVSVGTDI